MNEETLPPTITYCYNREKPENDPIMEALTAPYHPAPLHQETIDGIIYAATPAYNTLALYPYKGRKKKHTLPSVRIINLLYHLATNPLTRLGDTTIAIAVPQNYTPGTSLLPISRLAPIYKLDTSKCRETLHTAQTATALRATRQNIDLIISMITTTLTLLTENTGQENKLQTTLEALIQAYLAKTSQLAKSKIRAQSQEIARTIDITNPTIKTKINTYLTQIQQNPTNPQKIKTTINTILKDPTIIKTIIGRIIKQKDPTKYTGTPQQISKALNQLIQQQAQQHCHQTKNTQQIAYGVTGQFSLYDIKLIHETLRQCNTQQQALLLTTPETLPNLTITLNTLKDLNPNYTQIENNTIKIKTPQTQLTLKPILIPHTDPHIIQQIKQKLQRNSIKIINILSILLI